MKSFFSDATFVDKLAALLEKSLDASTCTVATTSRKNVATASDRDAVLDITIPAVGGGTVVKEIRYNQLDLASLAGVTLIKRLAIEDTTIYTLLPYIRRSTGLMLSELDLVDGPVVAGADLNQFTIPLVAKVGSKFFKGKYDLPVLRKPHLQTAMVTNYLGSI